MGTIMAIIIFALYFIIKKIREERAFNNYDHKKVSVAKMMMDINASPAQKRRNTVAGKYDKDGTTRF